MCRLEVFLLACLILTEVFQISRSSFGQRIQRRRYESYYHPKTRAVVAEDRRFPRIEYLKKQQTQKFRHFKKYFKTCGVSPFMFKILRRSDDGNLDTVNVMVPNEYHEYLTRVAPLDHYEYFTTASPSESESTKYSVKYRTDTPTDVSVAQSGYDGY